MPSALETLVKILKLERDQGCKNTAVIGGFAAFSEKWTPDAHAQAKKPEHHLLVDELSGLLQRYEAIETKTERVNNIAYMIDRITGRVSPPPEFQVKASDIPASSAATPPVTQQQSPPIRPQMERREEQPREQRPRQQQQPRKDRPAKPQPAQQSRPPRKPMRDGDDDDD